MKMFTKFLLACAAVWVAAGGDIFAAEGGLKYLGKVQVREGKFELRDVVREKVEQVAAGVYVPRGMGGKAGAILGTYFDEETLPQKVEEFQVGSQRVTRAYFTRYGQPLYLFWWCGGDGTREFDLELPYGGVVKPVKVDLVTGCVWEIGDGSVVKGVKMGVDEILFIAPRRAIVFERDWEKMTPFEIVDTFFKPGQYEDGMKGLKEGGDEAWRKMATKDFIPCIDKFGQFKWKDWEGKTRSAADLEVARVEEEKDLAAHPGPSGWTKFGGWREGPQLEATGRFRTHKDGKGTWWLVDPEGRLFWSFGPVRVSASSGMTPMNGDMNTPRTGVASAERDCLFEDLSLEKFWGTRDELLWPFYVARGETRVYDFSSANLWRKYGDGYYEVFADLCHRRLRSWGMNTIANSSDIKICLMDRTAYAERVECISRFIEGSHGNWWKFRDPWDESFVKGVTAALEAHGKEAHDPWCIGFFIDNEINWGGPSDLAKWTIQSAADQPAKIAFVEFLLKKYGTIEALNAAWGTGYRDRAAFLESIVPAPEKAEADLYEFSNEVIERYFRVTRETVKAFDEKLLYLGCRFAGWARDEVVAASAKYCDVVSYNIYAETLEGWRLPKGLDAPVMIGEFHFGATDRGPFGAGMKQAKDQEERAAKMTRYVESALRNPQMVGVHWHQFSDQPTAGRFDGEYQQVGLTDVCDRPYPIMRGALRKVGAKMYEVRSLGR